ncbi:MAG: hypothetical protein HZB23_02885 [Deltaproteobacteria bacterium]|nr:hypothetical protein [Deltaproteobacteria bacterium]
MATDSRTSPKKDAGWCRFGNLDSFLGFLNGLELSHAKVQEIKKSTAFLKDGVWYWHASEHAALSRIEDRLALFMGRTADSAPLGCFEKRVADLVAEVGPVREERPGFLEEPRNAILCSAMHDVFEKMIKTMPAALSGGAGSHEAEKLARLEELVKNAASGLRSRIFSQYLLLIPKNDIGPELGYLWSLGIRHIMACPVSEKAGRPENGEAGGLFWLLAFMGKNGQPPIAPRNSVLYYFLGGDGPREVYLACGWRYPTGWWRWLAPREKGLRLASGGKRDGGRDYDIGVTSLEFFPVSRFVRPDPRKAPEIAHLAENLSGSGEGGIRVFLELKHAPENVKPGHDKKSMRGHSIAREIRILENRVQLRRTDIRVLNKRLGLLRHELALVKGERDAASALAGAVTGGETASPPLMISVHGEEDESLTELVRDCSRRFLENTGYCRVGIIGADGERTACHILTPPLLISGRTWGRAGAEATGGSSTYSDNYGILGAGGRLFYAEPYWKMKGALVFLPEGFTLHPPFVFGVGDPSDACEIMGPLLCGCEEFPDKSAWIGTDWQRWVFDHIFIIASSKDNKPEILRIKREAIVSMHEGLRFRGSAGEVRFENCSNCGHPV